MSLSFGDDSLGKDAGASTILSSAAPLSGVARDPSYYCHDVIVLVRHRPSKPSSDWSDLNCFFRSTRSYSRYLAPYSTTPRYSKTCSRCRRPTVRPSTARRTTIRYAWKGIPRPNFGVSSKFSSLCESNLVRLDSTLICYRRYSAPEELTPEQWQSVLAFATKWRFQGVRETAIRKLDAAPLDPIDKLVLAIRHDVKQWLVNTLNCIAQRDAPLCPADAERLLPVVGIDYVLKIAQVREGGGVAPSGNSGCYCSNHGQHLSTSCSNGGVGNRASTDYSSAIRVVFGLQ
jgi:hypothetical protein